MPYTLYVYDTPLLKFDFLDASKTKTHDAKHNFLPSKPSPKYSIAILSINHQLEHLLPISLLTQESSFTAVRTGVDLELSLFEWFADRMPPSNRAFIRSILTSCGLNDKDPQGIADMTMMLSLTDSYRVVNDEHSFVPFAQCNLFENQFDEALAFVAYFGQVPVDYLKSVPHRPWLSTPELTTDGMLPKAWRWTDKGIMLYKSGSLGHQIGLEPYSEFYAAQVAKAMGLNIVPYGLETWHNKKGYDVLASTCHLFTSKDVSFVRVWDIMEDKNLNGAIRAFERIGYLDMIKDMFLLDAIICNTDRHYSNFGVLRNNRTGKIIVPAPVFDNGNSLFVHAPNHIFSDRETLQDYIEDRHPPYHEGYTFDELAEFALEGAPERLKRLQNMQDFTFKRHPEFNLETKRLEIIENILQGRVHRFLNLRAISKENNTGMDVLYEP